MPPTKLPPNGERYLPEFKGTIELEHLHRYKLAKMLAVGRDVLDIACGEGYGASILVESAKSVVGVDISPDAVEHAKSNYSDPRITFKVGSVTDIPIPNDSVDMVVSFETIEHLEDHDGMMHEIRRVLRPNGLLIISSPNKREYSDRTGYSNPFHVRELYTAEFMALVSRYFSLTKRYGQKLSASSLIAHDSDVAAFHFFDDKDSHSGIPDTRYDILLASDADLPNIPHSAFEISGSPLQPYVAETFQKEAAVEIGALYETIENAQHALNDAQQKAHEAATAAHEEKAEILLQFEEKKYSIIELQRRLRDVTLFSNDLLNSKWWRMTRHFRRWSNSLRKRRGRPKKHWPDKFDFSVEAVEVHSAGLNQEIWPTYTPVDGVISPFGRSSVGPNSPVVPYSAIQEDFVKYADHDPIDPSVRTIAFYLPQFHPFAQNDEWWGKGFTEWTNVGKARPLFPGHYQPHCPIHLGYYDLRVPQIMQEQAKLAKNYGISGFAYYFYWFAGQLLMETPLEAMLADPDVDLPFCMIWANENWTRRWDGHDQEVLIAQDHSLEDSRAMLTYLQKFMADERYIRVNGKPLFIIYRATLIPDFAKTLKMWRSEAKRMGLGDLYVVSAQTFGHTNPKDLGLDAAIEFPPHGINPREISSLVPGLVKDFSGGIFEYPEVVSSAVKQEEPDYTLFRTSMLSWDNTARRNLKASVFTDFSVTRYAQWLASNMERAAKDPRRSGSERLVFVNAWNEWAEGTHLEPDQKHGYGYLEATRSVVNNYSKDAEVFLRPVVPDTTTARFAIVAHVHYSDTWPEMMSAISKLKDIDVYVTVTNFDLACTIATDMPSAVVELVDNRGRDVRPFLMTMQRISHLGYRAVCKVHGKKSVYRNDGDSLREQLFSTLINEEIMTKFEENDRLGFIGTASSMLEHNNTNMKATQKLVDEISNEMKIPFLRGRFAAGTMFWADPRAIEPILKLRVNDFDIERGLADGTRAHAIERLFCVVCEAKGFEIDTVN